MELWSFIRLGKLIFLTFWGEIFVLDSSKLEKYNNFSKVEKLALISFKEEKVWRKEYDKTYINRLEISYS